jgi:D-glycero-D-manno-heptose 1,7-bisphosphate phosphatase
MRSEKIKAVFLDRDGIINKDFGYVHKIGDFEFNDLIFDTCRTFKKQGYEIIIITNQSGIARNYFTNDDYIVLNKWMIKSFANNSVDILEVFHCPHLPESNCNCRKPKPGMLLNALKKYNIDKSISWMIGDKESDIIAANAAGINNTILVLNNSDNKIKKTKAKFIIESLEKCKEIINN